jgi:hypothetical protein
MVPMRRWILAALVAVPLVGCGPAPGSFCDLDTPLPSTGDRQADANRNVIRIIYCMNQQASQQATWASILGPVAGAFAAQQSAISNSLSIQGASFGAGLGAQRYETVDPQGPAAPRVIQPDGSVTTGGLPATPLPAAGSGF